MKMMLHYARRHWKTAALLGVFAAADWIVFWLYDLPPEPTLYAGAIGLTVGLIMVGVDFARFRKRHRLLLSLAERFEAADLPEPEDLLEADYQAVARALDARRRAADNRHAEAQREMTDYYTLWAHQIKIPISALRLLLQSGAEPVEMEEELFRIERYVEMVLGYLRSESLSGDLMIRRCDLDEIVRGCVRKYRRQFIRRRVSLDYEPLGVTVLTDAKWLAFVIEQVLANALKYTPEEGRISICMDRARPNALTISDTGIGIRSEDLPRVFERGYTGLNGREGDRHATGIGLYLCKRILTRLGHDIEIESAPGQGTKVILCLDSVKLEIE